MFPSKIYVFIIWRAGYIFVPFFIITAIIALLFPAKVISFKQKLPFIFYPLLILVFLLQAPLLFFGLWGLQGDTGGTPVAKANIVEISLLFLLFLYIIIFILSLFSQSKNREIKTVSLGVAFYSTLILSPFIYFSIMVLLNYILGKFSKYS
jgi:hypothetical protein